MITQSGVRTRSPSPTPRSTNVGSDALRNKSFGKPQETNMAKFGAGRGTTGGAAGGGSAVKSRATRTGRSGIGSHKKSETRSNPLMARRKVVVRTSY